MRIVVAVDGSDQSFYAVRALEHFARAEHVVLLHAVDVPLLAYPLGGEPRIMQDFSMTLEQTMWEEGERLVKQAASFVPMGAGSASRKIERGTPAEAILSAAAKEQADLIVLGSRGLGQVKEMLLGSVSHRVASHATCPVLVVNRPMRSLQHLMVAAEGPEDAAVLVEFLAKKPFRHPVETTVLTVLPIAQPMIPAGFSKLDALIEKTVTEGRAFVERVASELSALGLNAKGYVLMGAPAQAILQEVAASKPDLLVMRARNRPDLSRFLLGSVSHTILHRAACPTLIVR